MSRHPSEDKPKQKGELAEAKEPSTPTSSSTAAEATTPYQYENVSPIIISARNQALEKFRKANKTKRNSSGKVASSVIEVDEGSAKMTTSIKNSGYDENFATRLNKDGDLARYDAEMGLTGSPLGFVAAFQHSRLPTNSYIHFEGADAETTGHSGGFFHPPQSSSNSSELRKFSAEKIKTYKKNSGSKHAGSLGE